MSAYKDKMLLLIVLFTATSLTNASVVKNRVDSCGLDEFACTDGACVSRDVVCDSRRDCADGSDESACSLSPDTNFMTDPILHRERRQANQGSCPKRFQWRCRDGTCISFDKKCDGAADCADRSDEAHAVCRNITCQPNWFRCTYGACVDGTAACNGVAECADESDELLPQCRKESDEVRGKFKCQDGSLISVGDKCDGVPNCPDGSDETVRACGSVKCSSYLFQCAYGACVDQGSDCNNIRDCADGSDEDDILCNRMGSKPVYTTTTTARPSSGTNGLCVLPPYPEHGHYEANIPNARPGLREDFVTVNFTCQNGYQIEGNADIYCYEGQWQYPFPKCVRLCKLNLSNPTVQYFCQIPNTNGGTRNCKAFEPVGTVAEPKCRSHYYSPTNLPLLRCINGDWDYSVHCVPECGKVTPEATGLVSNGVSAKHGELPWHVGIYRKTTEPYKQICGGSIISTSVVISAAHCFWDDTVKLQDPKWFAVAAGKIYRPWHEAMDKFAQHRDVSNLIIPDTFYGSETNYDYDVAIVLVSQPFEYKVYIRPVCINFNLELEKEQLKTGSKGKVAGWGFTGPNDPPSPVLKVVELPYISERECLARAPPGYRDLVTSQKFCTGAEDRKTVCKGDSGGGLVFPSKELGVLRYYLRGIVSTAPQTFDQCNVVSITTFSHVSKSEAFIKPYLSDY
ncbi:modular serine protease [Plutella xylostella]|uniref:modular serine protease n=1 Tax=Plutella xylostella TaxID=51655 RepID=UPI002032A36F|nr:modular serine protease [Plutella xylostella]